MNETPEVQPDGQAERPVEPIQSLGGKARAEKLTPEERSDIARAAAEARWDKSILEEGGARLPRATHPGTLTIGSTKIPVAVLSDGTRVITQRGMFVALGMNKNPSKGQTAIDNRPAFVGATNLNPFIPEDLRRSWNPVPFRMPKGSGGYKGSIAFGYDAKILPLVCQTYLDAHEAKALRPKQQDHIYQAAKLLHRGFAIVGIIALIDEATNYQEVRDRLALQEVLRQYITGALFEWTKTFPVELYKEIFRLKGWPWNSGKMPPVVGKYVNDLVYNRLAPGVLNELQRVNPPTEKGYRTHKHHQFLTRDIGHPALARRLYELLGMARVSENWGKFYRAVDRAFPKLNATLPLPLND
jgi:hypothetical protein